MPAGSFVFQTVTAPGADLGTWLGGINNAGQVAGYSVSTAVPVPQAFIDTGGSFSPITGIFQPKPADLNNAGQVVGAAGTAQSGVSGFLWSPSGTQQITAQPLGTHVRAFGVNDDGTVVGVIDWTHPGEGFVWQAGSMSTFQAPGAFITEAHGINNTGTIVGTADSQGFVDVGGQFSFLSLGTITDPMAINSGGTIAGSYNDGTHWHGFIDAGGQMSFIDSPGATDTWVTGINDAGTIVGYDSVNGAAPQGFIATDPPAVDPVQALVRQDYLAGLDRDAEAGGLAGWSQAVRNGMTAADLAQGIAGSSEFQSLHGQQSDAEYVDSLYVNALGRHAESGGLAGWIGALNAGASRASVFSGIAQSSEGQQHFAALHG